jgi:hypothetical protein
MSKAIIITGFTGSGKTMFCKTIALTRENVLVFDINNEYELPEIDLNKPYTGGRYKYTGMNFNKFMAYICEYTKDGDQIRKVYDTNIVLEDCSGFMKGQIGKYNIQTFQAKRHTRNNYFFLYHAVELIPKDIYRFTNTFVLFNTNESLEQIEKRFPVLKGAAFKVKKEHANTRYLRDGDPKKYPKIITQLQ